MKNRDILEEITGIYNERKNTIPLVHVITNKVTMNDVAQSIIYAGGKPIMAHWEEEAWDITSAASALVLNIGTPDENEIRGIKKAAEAASQKGIPIVLDPVGIQVSPKRMELARYLLDEANISLIKGNYSEIKSLINLKSNFIGIDSLDDDLNHQAINMLKDYSADKNLIIILTGKDDYIIYSDNALKISNGTPLLSKITGSGCILSGILGALCGMAESEKELFFLSSYGLLLNSIAGEKAKERLVEGRDGLHSFKYNFMDELSLVREEDILERGRVQYV